MADWWESAPLAKPASGDDWWKAAPVYSPAKPGVAEDMAGGIQGGIIRGAAGLPGLVGGALGLMDQGADIAARHTVGRVVNYARGNGFTADTQPAVDAPRFSPQANLPGPSQTIDAVEGVIGKTYRPQTTPGQYASSVGEMVGGGLRGLPAVAAGVLSEGAGQATHGTALEPWARAGGAIVGGAGAAIATRPGVAESIVGRATGGMTPQQLDAMEALMRDAAAVGVPLSRAEAAQQVTNGATRLADLQRVVEGRGGLKDFYAGRPDQIEAAGARTFDGMAPVSPTPSMIGPAVGEAAQAEIGGVQGAINQATRPLYQAAETQRVGPQIQAALAGDPLYARTLQEVRANPALNRTVEHLPDDAVGVIDLVQRRMREQAENAAVPGHANSGNLIAGNFENARQAPIAAAETATGSQAATATQPAVAGTYEAARAAQATLRQQFLEPLMAGPIGRLARADVTTKRAVEALFPTNPTPGSADEVFQAVTALSQRNPGAAAQLVRVHAESVFNEATQALQSGPNQFGGATFAAVLRGNRQQADNLSAAVQALPNGAQILPGFDRFLDIMQATGQRQRIGSQTAFNTEALTELKTGGNVGTVAALGAGAGTQLPRKVLERFQEWNLGRNVDAVARLLTDPAAAPLFRHLASAQAGAARTNALLSRLVGIAGGSSAGTERAGNPAR